MRANPHAGKDSWKESKKGRGHFRPFILKNLASLTFPLYRFINKDSEKLFSKGHPAWAT